MKSVSVITLYALDFSYLPCCKTFEDFWPGELVGMLIRLDESTGPLGRSLLFFRIVKPGLGKFTGDPEVRQGSCEYRETTFHQVQVLPPHEWARIDTDKTERDQSTKRAR